MATACGRVRRRPLRRGLRPLSRFHPELPVQSDRASAAGQARLPRPGRLEGLSHGRIISRQGALPMSTAMAADCLLLARVAGGARLAERLGAIEASLAVGRCLQRIERAVFGCGGRVIQAVGADGTMAHFASPGAALSAARQMLSAVAALPPVAGVQLDVCCAFVDPGEDELSSEGDAGCRATRLLSVFAQPGQILTSRATVARLPPALQSLAREVGIVPAAIGESAGAITVMAID